MIATSSAPTTLAREPFDGRTPDNGNLLVRVYRAN